MASTTVVYLEVDDVDATVAALAALAARGIAPVSPPRDEPWLWREARFADPSGNVTCLYQAGSTHRFPPWRIA